MNAKQKLLAAAEKIEQQVTTEFSTALPWAKDRGDVAHFFPQQQEYGAICSPGDGDANLIVTAVNAMPALAAWLRWEAECAGVPEHSHKALAVADQILGGAR